MTLMKSSCSPGVVLDEFWRQASILLLPCISPAALKLRLKISFPSIKQRISGVSSGSPGGPGNSKVDPYTPR